MKIVSLFDGLSCAQVAINKLEIKDYIYYASEIDKYAIAVTQYNYPNTVQLGDITEIKGNNFKDVDILIGGSPCQDLSIAKKNRGGLNGSRSGLFYEYVRLLNEIKPKYFILENVNSMPKEAKEIISKTLGVEPIMINASLVSAQNRKRLFWVGKLIVDRYEQIIINQPEDKLIYLKNILEDKPDICSIKSHTIRVSGRGSGIKDRHNWDTIKIGYFNSVGQGDRIYSEEGKSVTLSVNGGGRGAKTGLYLIKEIAMRTRDKGYKEVEIRKDEKTNALTTVQTDSMVIESDIVRKLTPIECERLQTVPDNYTSMGSFDGKIKEISNSQRYKMLGNSFCCDVIVHILSYIKKELS